MSEMLANRYFISRKFDLALPIFEQEFARGNRSEAIKKKLIVCYSALGRAEDAFDLFFELIHQDPNIIINTDPYWDDCPCPELIKKWEQKQDTKSISPREALILGMMYLYCNVNKSIEYLQQALEYEDYFLKISSILKKLKNIQKKPQITAQSD